MRWLVALGVAAVTLAACGDGSSNDPEPSPAGGAQAEERVLDELGADAAHAGSRLQLCDGSKVEVITVSGGDAIDTWEDLRDDADDTALWPVLVGAPTDTSLLADVVRFNCKDGSRFKKTLRDASKTDIDSALSKVAKTYGVRAQDLRGSPPLPEYPYPKDQFLVPLDLQTEEPLPEVDIALLPIQDGWQATAILPWGNYNDNPGPALHTAVLRDWNHRYGAEVVSLTGEVIELSVSRPPATEEDALALAREQFQYAPDIVQQGLGDVETLAAAVQDGSAWYFWWD